VLTDFVTGKPIEVKEEAKSEENSTPAEETKTTEETNT